MSQSTRDISGHDQPVQCVPLFLGQPLVWAECQLCEPANCMSPWIYLLLFKLYNGTIEFKILTANNYWAWRLQHRPTSCEVHSYLEIQYFSLHCIHVMYIVENISPQMKLLIWFSSWYKGIVLLDSEYITCRLHQMILCMNSMCYYDL